MNTKKPTSASLPSKLAWIRLFDFEALCFNLAREHLTFDQPIPDFETRSPGVLESCLRTPLQQFEGKDLYKSPEEKLATLFYLMVKNHPFQNGNKRIALTTLLAVLFFNKRWLRTTSLEIYRLAKEVTESKREEREKTLKRIQRFINRQLIELPAR